jgi:hypothetical protein
MVAPAKALKNRDKNGIKSKFPLVMIIQNGNRGLVMLCTLKLLVATS